MWLRSGRGPHQRHPLVGVPDPRGAKKKGRLDEPALQEHTQQWLPEENYL